LEDPMSATDLDGRIAGVLSRMKALPDDVAALLGEVEAALVKVGDELSRARSEAFDPMSSAAVIASARGTIFECEFRHGRLVAARDALGTKHQEAVARVEQERRAAAHADLIARRDELAARFEGVWREHAEPLASYLHEVATVDEEIGTSNRLRLGPWLDRTESVARPGVSDLDQHKLVSMATRLPPWDHDAHRSGELLWPPQPARLDPRAMVPAELVKREEAIGAEAAEATRIASRLEEANRLARGARRRVLAGSW
jgi:hypothetical protein